MLNHDTRPLYILALAASVGLIFAIGTNKAMTNKPLTFEQRWAPVYEINAGVKGDRLDRKTPTGDAPSGPSGHFNWQANPYNKSFKLACASFCEFP